MLLSFSSWAQRTQSFSIGAGAGAYYGDLSDKLHNLYINPAITASYSYYFTPGLSIRTGVSVTQIGAEDALADDPARIARNLEFVSNIFEVSAVAVWEIFPDKNYGMFWRHDKPLTPYVFGGVALFSFAPKADYQGTMHKLQPLGTEGQLIRTGGFGAPYSQLQVSLPFGIGVNWRFWEQWGLNVEVGYRKTFTDYLDDVSGDYAPVDDILNSVGPIAAALSNRSEGTYDTGQQRGNPGVKDSYFITSVSIVYYLDRFGRW